MMSKGTMLPLKKILGWISLIIGILLIISKDKIIRTITIGFFIGNFYVSLLSILLLIIAYFFIISGRRFNT